MVLQATLMLFGSFFVMLLAGVPISAGISIAIWGSLQKSQNTATDSPHAAAKIRIN